MSDVSPPSFDPYKVLQVDAEADPEVIQAAYRRLAQKHHPDLAGAEAADRMRRLNAAWEILRDPERRAAYDRSRAALPASGPGGVGSSARRTAAPAPHHDVGGADGRTHAQAGAGTQRPPEPASPDWSSGRSSVGGAYDPATMRTPEGQGAAGPPPGNPSGSVLSFGRYAGWSLGEIGRRDLEYVEWLDRVPIGRAYREEIDVILRRAGRRTSSAAEAAERRGLYRRR